MNILKFFGIGMISNEPEPVVEPISTKKFIFMSVLGISTIVGFVLLS